MLKCVACGLDGHCAASCPRQLWKFCAPAAPVRHHDAQPCRAEPAAHERRRTATALRG